METKYSPLVVRMLYNEDPRKLQSQSAIYKNFQQNWHSEKKVCFENGKCYVAKWDKFEFRNHDRVYIYNLTSKFCKFLIGKPLDYLYEMPGADQIIITKIIEKSSVYFRFIEDYYSFENFPKHIPESYEAELAYQNILKWGQTPISWMVANIFKRMHSQGVLEEYLQRAFVTEIQGVTLRDPKIKKINITSNSAVDSAEFNGDLKVKRQQIYRQGKIPETMKTALIGKEYKEVIDHWLFAGTRVKNIHQYKENYAISFDGENTKKLKQWMPDEYQAIVEKYDAIRKTLRPENLQKYHDEILSKEAGYDPSK